MSAEQQRAEKKPEQPKQEIAIRPAMDAIRGKAAEFQALIPGGVDRARFINMILSELHRNTALHVCTQQSIIAAVGLAARTGLEVGGPLAQAHLIAYKKRDKQGNLIGSECQFQLDYKGLIALGYRSGAIIDVVVELVYEKDEYSRDGRGITHKRDSFMKDRGAVVGGYCILRQANGGELIEEMSTEEIENTRSRSKASKDGPWMSDWGEMAKKTVIRRAYKKVQFAPEYKEAIEAGDEPDGVWVAPAEPPEGRKLGSDAMKERVKQRQREATVGTLQEGVEFAKENPGTTVYVDADHKGPPVETQPLQEPEPTTAQGKLEASARKRTHALLGEKASGFGVGADHLDAWKHHILKGVCQIDSFTKLTVAQANMLFSALDDLPRMAALTQAFFEG